MHHIFCALYISYHIFFKPLLQYCLIVIQEVFSDFFPPPVDHKFPQPGKNWVLSLRTIDNMLGENGILNSFQCELGSQLP